MKKKVLFIITGFIAIIFGCLVSVSCLTTDTAYRVGYDIGSWIADQ